MWPSSFKVAVVEVASQLVGQISLLVVLIIILLLLVIRRWSLLMLYVGSTICQKVVFGAKSVYIPMCAVMTIVARIILLVVMVILLSHGENKGNLVPDGFERTQPLNNAGEISSRESSVPLSPVTLCLNEWKLQLESDPDFKFIINGIQNGFNIVDTDLSIEPCMCKNYKSTEENRLLVEDQINKEILKGRYIVTNSEPYVVSALGAIPKSATKIRLIHDLSRPSGGVNRLAEDTAVVYPTIEEATRSMTSKTFLAKIDLSEAIGQYLSMKLILN
jgi:hypothetical protein